MLVVLVLGVLTLLASFVAKEEQSKKVYLQIGMLTISPSLVSTILLLMAKRKIWLVELTNLVFFLVAGMVCLLINGFKVTGELNDLQRQQ